MKRELVSVSEVLFMLAPIPVPSHLVIVSIVDDTSTGRPPRLQLLGFDQSFNLTFIS